MNFKYFTSKLTPSVVERAFDLFYISLTQNFDEPQFVETMDQLIRALEKGLHLV